MNITMNDVAKARDIISDLLTELNVEAVLFEIEPINAQWELNVECAVDDGWQMIRVPISKKSLLDCASDSDVRKDILNKIQNTLSSCKHA